MKKIAWKTVGWLALFVFALFFLTQQVVAQDDFQGVQFDPSGDIAKATKLPTRSPVDVTVRAIQWGLGFLGLAAVIMIMYGGFTWMTAAGNEERVTKAKNIIKFSVIGLIITLTSWAFITFVIARVGEFST